MLLPRTLAAINDGHAALSAATRIAGPIPAGVVESLEGAQFAHFPAARNNDSGTFGQNYLKNLTHGPLLEEVRPLI
jgi:hypothetical protein